MNEALVEKIADAIAPHFSGADVALGVHKDAARAAITAMESAGYRRVDPALADYMKQRMEGLE